MPITDPALLALLGLTPAASYGVQRLGVDTCGCFLYEAQDHSTNPPRVLGYVTYEQALAMVTARYEVQPAGMHPPATWAAKQGPRGDVLCRHHEAVGKTVTRYNAVMAEVRRKNIAVDISRSIKTSLTTEDVRWSYDDARVLHLGFTQSLTAKQRSDVQAACDLQFGTGKVVLDG